VALTIGESKQNIEGGGEGLLEGLQVNAGPLGHGRERYVADRETSWTSMPRLEGRIGGGGAQGDHSSPLDKLEANQSRFRARNGRSEGRKIRVEDWRRGRM